MTAKRRVLVQRAVATSSAVALLIGMAACSGSDEKTPVAESAASPAVEAEQADGSDAEGDTDQGLDAESEAAEAGSEDGVATGTGVGAVHVRSTHIQSWTWTDPSIREPIVALIKAGKLDNVQLDIKDEDGIVGYDSQVAVAQEAGTVYQPVRMDAEAVLKEIHDLGATVTGRIVAFRDPRLGKWALNNDKMDWLIQDSSGNPYPAGNYGVGAFTNFANPEVVEYNIALGVEAAKLGFDSIMYDYIRKPENSGQVYPGIGDRTPAEAIVDFVEEAGPRIRAAGASAGAAVYGISSFAPSSVAQDIPEMAKHLDYVSPMIYPSHWNAGEYSVNSPIDQPYDIVKRSLMDFNRLVIDTDCAIVPWLQNFSWPTPYTASDVAAQIKASRDVGINSFYLWHASSKVGLGAPALLAGDPADNVPSSILYSIDKPGNFSEGTTDIDKARLVYEAYQAWNAAGREGSFPNPLDEPEPGATASASTETESTDEATE